MITNVVVTVIAVLVGTLVFLVLRQAVLWYFRINERADQIHELVTEIKALRRELQSAREEHAG